MRNIIGNTSSALYIDGNIRTKAPIVEYCESRCICGCGSEDDNQTEKSNVRFPWCASIPREREGDAEAAEPNAGAGMFNDCLEVLHVPLGHAPLLSRSSTPWSICGDSVKVARYDDAAIVGALLWVDAVVEQQVHSCHKNQLAHAALDDANSSWDE